MQFSYLALVSTFVEAALAAQAKNFIYIVPDGYGPASQTLARDYASLLINGENPNRPVTYQLPVDKLIIGSVRTQASDSLVTDSAASATAFACGVKTYNAAIGVDDDVQPVGSILEAAHLQGFKTGLIATSRITHATPACYAAHVAHRDSEAKIAEHEVGYGHPLGQTVDILLGGGRGFFIPQNQTGSSRKDDLNLLEYAKSQGFSVHTDRKGFELLRNGLGQAAKLPYIGLYTNSHMSYELDRNPSLEPSLREMAEAAINSLHAATKDAKKGYFLMIEASRIDHAGHSNDPVGHLHDTLMYNEVVDYVRSWINRHPETQMLSAADHECGGLTLVQEGYNPLILKNANATVEALATRFSRYTGSDAAGFLRSDIYPAYGISNPTSAEVAQLVPLKGSSNFGNALGRQISARAGINWATAQHSAVDISLFGYASPSENNKALRAEMGGNWDNTQLPGYIEKALGIRVKDATAALRKDGTGWVGKRDLAMEKRSEHHHM